MAFQLGAAFDVRPLGRHSVGQPFFDVAFFGNRLRRSPEIGQPDDPYCGARIQLGQDCANLPGVVFSLGVVVGKDDDILAGQGAPVALVGGLRTVERCCGIDALMAGQLARLFPLSHEDAGGAGQLGESVQGQRARGIAYNPTLGGGVNRAIVLVRCPIGFDPIESVDAARLMAVCIVVGPRCRRLTAFLDQLGQCHLGRRVGATWGFRLADLPLPEDGPR